MRSFMILILYRSLGGAEQCIPLKVNKDFSEINGTKSVKEILVFDPTPTLGENGAGFSILVGLSKCIFHNIRL